MKITEETKLKELIPDGWELSDNIVVNRPNIYDGKPMLFVWLQKKQKDFKWYGYEYEKYVNQTIFETEYFNVSNSKRQHIGLPFEFKIGLLKFICEDVGVGWANVVSYLNHKYVNKMVGLDSTPFRAVLDICPEEFLKSIV